MAVLLCGSKAVHSNCPPLPGGGGPGTTEKQYMLMIVGQIELSLMYN
jgi:hypothetical protein